LLDYSIHPEKISITISIIFQLYRGGHFIGGGNPNI
jgi:hypothetical protein